MNNKTAKQIRKYVRNKGTGLMSFKTECRLAKHAWTKTPRTKRATLRKKITQ